MLPLHALENIPMLDDGAKIIFKQIQVTDQHKEENKIFLPRH